jgi:hypothetical protein
MINSQFAVVVMAVGALLWIGGIFMDASPVWTAGAVVVGFGLGAVLSHD